MGRVLFVEDEKDLTEACSLILSTAGHDVAVAHDGAEALGILTKEPFDLVITDLRMPRVDGFTVLRWIVSHKPDTKVVVMTGFGSPVVSDTARRLGALHCLNKPLGKDRLLETVRSVLGESGFSATVQNITVADYVQLCMYTGKTSNFDVSSGGKRGTIAVVEGTLTHAEQGDLKGESAFFEIVSWEGGQINEKKLDAPLTPNVHTPGQALLLEALRLKDEAKTARQQEAGLPAPESPPPPEVAPPVDHLSGASPSSATDQELSRGSQHAVPAAPAAASELAGLPQRLSQDREVIEYGVFVEQDLLRYKRSVTGAILQAAPSLYLKLGDTLREQLRGGALQYVVIHTKGGARYLVFDCLNARAVVGLRPDTRVEDFWKTLRRQ
jgi:DNA-binding response OmpR family regulator